MSDTELFRFFSGGLPNQNLHVVSFTGEEGLGRLFSFKIELVCDDPDLDLAALLFHRAVFSIEHGKALKEDERRERPLSGGRGQDPEKDRRSEERRANSFSIDYGQGFENVRKKGERKASTFYGYPVSATQKGSYKGYTYYSVDFRPNLWLLTQAVESTIFLNQSLSEVAFSILNAHKMRAIPYENRLMRHHPEQEFAMQYGESMYDYLVWRLEQEGAYFYFDPMDGRLVLADSPNSHNSAKETFLYSPISGLLPPNGEEIVTSLSLSQSFLPKQVVVRSYDWRNPNLLVVGKADVYPTGIGDVYLTDEAVESNAEARRIASIRAEEMVCHSRVFHGASTIPSLRPGRIFDLEGNYAKSFDQTFLVTEVVHSGSQESFLSLGLGIPLRDSNGSIFYRNTFSCIDARFPFRPRRNARRAKVSGSIRAFIDGAEGGKPETDKYGRYKLLFPFDVSGRKAGKASCWIRMARPHVGKQSSLNFPLCPGTEVLVSFIDGNPDRPVITGALANGENPLGTSPNIAGITTNGGNVFAINDSGTKQGMAMLTAAGVGSVTSSGSISTKVDSQDRVLTAASISSATFASGCISSTACIRNTLMATKDMALYISKLVPMIGATLKKIYTSVDQHSEKGDEAVSWISSMLPFLSNIIFLIIQNKKKNPIGYGLTATNNDIASSLNLFVKMTKKEMALHVIPPFLLRAGVRAVDVAMDVKNGDTRYDTNAKKPTKAEIALATINDLLPEILSLIIIFATIKTKDKVGGIGIQARNSNVNITAKTVASMHAGKNIILSTHDLSTNNLFGTITEVGTKDNDSNFIIETKYVNPIPANTSRFIKINTEVMHTDNDYTIFRNKKNFHSEATEHNFFSFNQEEGNQDKNRAELSLVYTPNNDTTKSESKINLYANKIFLKEGHEDTSADKGYSSSIEINKKILLSFKYESGEDKRDGEINLDSNNLNIETKDDGKSTNSIVMYNNKENPTTKIKCNSTAITIDGADKSQTISVSDTKIVDFSSADVKLQKITANGGGGNLTISGNKISIG